MARTIVCPFCFSECKSKDVAYRCVNQRCPGKSTPEAEDAAYFGYYRKKPGRVGRVLKETGLTFLGRPKVVACEHCGESNTNVICPNCHNPLPSASVSGDANLIAVVGTRAAGKSLYITVLIEELTRRVGHRMGAAVSAYTALGDCGYSARDLYMKTKYKHVYEQQQVIDLTSRNQLAAALDDDKIPLIYTWGYPQGSRLGNRQYTMAFFDAAGEDLEDPQVVATAAEYLRHAKGIIFLIDPLQFRTVHDEVESCIGHQVTSLGGRALEGTDGGPKGVLDNIARLIRNARGIQEGRPINVPVAVTFTKFDEVLPIAADAINVAQPSPHQGMGAFMEADQKGVDGEIRALLERWEEGSFITNVNTNFPSSAFFAVSSLGFDNAPSAQGAFDAPRPHRVEDPLLWLMSELKMIPTA